jgi:hypothetical protein
MIHHQFSPHINKKNGNSPPSNTSYIRTHKSEHLLCSAPQIESLHRKENKNLITHPRVTPRFSPFSYRGGQFLHRRDFYINRINRGPFNKRGPVNNKKGHSGLFITPIWDEVQHVFRMDNDESPRTLRFRRGLEKNTKRALFLLDDRVYFIYSIRERK